MKYPTGSFAWLDRNGSEASQRSSNVRVGSLPRPEAMAELVRSIGGDGRIRHVRDPDFFRWRFENPTRQYRFFYYESDGKLNGFIAVAGYRRSNLQFNIVDIEARNEDVLGELLESVCSSGNFPAVGTWLASHSPVARTLLTHHGFVATDPGLRARGMPCALLKKIGSAESPAIVGTWDIRLIDSMHG